MTETERQKKLGYLKLMGTSKILILRSTAMRIFRGSLMLLRR